MIFGGARMRLPRYRALLVGNWRYEADAQNLPDLKGPLNDISRLAAALIDQELGMFVWRDVSTVAERASHEILYAADGLGCWWNGKRARVSEISEMKKAVFSYTSWSSFRTTKRTRVFERFDKECFYGRGWGDAYGYHMVATGRAEIMLDPTISIWDVAPFAPIFRERQ